MTYQIRDPHVQTLAAIAATLSQNYIVGEDDPWQGSPFRWILSLPSRAKGAVGEGLVAGWAAANGFDVVRSPDSEADRIINGHRIEVKFSTLWKNGGFKFQQIRDQDYAFCLCLGISPFDAQAWLLSKEVLLERVIGTMGQHTGSGGRDTAWLSIQASRPDEWLSDHGGRLHDVYKMIEDAGRGPSKGRD